MTSTTTDLSTLETLANEAFRQANSAADYVQTTTAVRLDHGDDGYRLRIGDDRGLDLPELDGGLGITGYGHATISESLGIPKRYYDRLLADRPEILLANVNGLFQAEPKRHLFRTIDGRMRAMLSDRYRRIDNWDILKTAMPILAERPDLQLKEAAITERKLYVKLLLPRTQAEVAVGDVVQAGVMITNSEVGCGSASVSPFMFRLVCLNGMVATEYGKSRHHVGRRIEDTPEARLIYSEATQRLDDQALLAKFADTVRAACDETIFQSIVSQCRELAKFRLDVPPAQVVERLRKRVTLSDEEAMGVQTNLIQAGEMTGWGLLNAITATARVMDDVERKTELESEAGRLLEATDREILALATA